ncbi:hypothetical protein EDD22DRAFT_887203 [Suillus occidentalis]|nr:hypothetical protein EDD22DRAFT_887203 [Suillus occidentalis]
MRGTLHVLIVARALLSSSVNLCSEFHISHNSPWLYCEHLWILLGRCKLRFASIRTCIVMCCDIWGLGVEKGTSRVLFRKADKSS